MLNPSILIIEDDTAIQNLISTTLEINDYKHQICSNGKNGLSIILSNNPDIIILDLGLPDIDGIEIIKKVRGWSNVAIIVVSARNEDSDKIAALDAGADDYLTKPFSIDELLARIRVNLRRIEYMNSRNNDSSSIFENKNLKIDYSSACVFINNNEIHLTPIEYKLLTLLSNNVGRVLTYNSILKEVWGSTLESEIPSLRVFMTTLRKKIEKFDPNTKYIQTHVGIGYRMIKL